MEFSIPRNFQTVRRKMEEIINLLQEKQAEEHDVTHILNLRQKIGEAFRKREAETAINLLN